MSSLSVKCSNCYHNSVDKCELVEIPVPNFKKIDNKITRLEEIEETAEEAEEAAIAVLQAARAKLS
jgi:hypothetical protein